MKNITTLFVLFTTLLITAQVPANYYNSANGLTGYALKTELRNIIAASHQPHSYNQLYTAYQTTDVDTYYENDGTVLDMYSEKPSGTDAYNYTHNANHCGNYNSESDCFNREHIMPQSVFSSASPMKADAHFVVPSDGYVNGSRGSLPFGEVGNSNWVSTNGSKRGTSSVTGFSGTVFEPIDEFKGDIARMLLYFATRYENQVSNWNHAMLNGTSNQVYADWFIDLLLQWNNQDPVSQREIDRNNAVYNYQNNANPFIDHPEWVSTIWNPTPDTQNPTTPTNLMASNISFNAVDLTWTASTDDNAVIGYDIYRNGTLIGSSPANPTTYTDNGLAPTTIYSYYVVAKDAAINFSTNSNTVTITTLDGPLFSEDFETCSTSNNFITYNEASNKNWTCITANGENNSSAMQMNGYQEDVPSKDWLITANSIDFSIYDNELLSVFLAHSYGTMPIELLYSTNFDGVSNPANYNWVAMPNVTIDIPDGTPNNVTQVITNADIGTLTQAAYVAFKYYSNGSPTRWTVDSFTITGDLTTNAIADNTFANKLKMYPNPSKGIVNFKANSTIKEIAIYNQLGQILISNKEQNTVNISSLNKGVYMVKIIDQYNNIGVKKLIKQ